MKRIWIALSFSLFTLQSLAEDGYGLYQTCIACHGRNAEGIESQFAPQLAGQDAAYLEEQLNNFSNDDRGTHPEDTYGQIMRASAKPLSAEDSKILARYLSKLTVEPVSTASKGNVENGARIYRANCADCHGYTAKGIAPVYAPNLRVLGDWYLKSQIRAYRQGWRGSEQSTSRAKGMRSMAEQFNNEQEVDDVIAWVRSLDPPSSESKL